MTNTTRSEPMLAGLIATLFAVSAGVTVRWCASMSTMPEMPMPGGWSMSMTWMPMPGQSWAAAAANFVAMWTVMMVAMMLPALTPMLRHYRQSVGMGLLAACGYFSVYTLVGCVVFPLGAALAALAMRFPRLAAAVPAASGALMLTAGVLNCLPAKKRWLAACRDTLCCTCGLQLTRMTALRHGAVMGVRCCRCCAGPMAILLVLGVMDLQAMVLVTVAVTLERLAPAGSVIAGFTGVLVAVAGLSLAGRSLGAW